MPTIRQYDVPVEAEVTVDFNVEVDEFLDDCDASEIDEIIEWLHDKGHLRPTHVDKSSEVSASESLYMEALDKLYTKWNMLSKFEEETILNLAKRF